MLDIKGFQASFKMYDPLAAAWPAYGLVYPFIELTLGLCYIRDFIPDWVLWVTIVVLSTTTLGVVQTLLKKRAIQCACLGSVLKLPMTEATFIENAIMIVMAGSLLL
jgi:ABC-type multidrug transport system permease subunit